jgi:hypothetical protein
MTSCNRGFSARKSAWSESTLRMQHVVASLGQKFSSAAAFSSSASYVSGKENAST